MQTRLIRTSFLGHDTAAELGRVVRLELNVDRNKREGVVWRWKLAVIATDDCERAVCLHYVLANASFFGFLCTSVNTERANG